MDARGVSLELESPPRRVVSLVPSLTESLFELGFGDRVVGMTEYCIFPQRVDVTRVGGTKTPNIDHIRSLEPDLVFMNLEENLPKHAREIETFAPLHVSEPKSVRDVVGLIRSLGAIFERRGNSEAFASMLEREMAVTPVKSFTFACPIWKKPWMWCGGDTYVSDLISTAGGTNLLAHETRYPKKDLTDVLAHDPDVILLPDEPFAFTKDDARELLERGARGAAGPFEGHLVTWHGTRTLRGLRFLRELAGTF
jgi:ABC-type Fe3+-hydroxamate transport system substrate-binding protein